MVFIQSRNRNCNFSNVRNGTGTVINSYGSATLERKLIYLLCCRLLLFEEIKPNMLEKLDDLQQPLEQVLEEVMCLNEFKGALLELFSKGIPPI